MPHARAARIPLDAFGPNNDMQRVRFHLLSNAAFGQFLLDNIEFAGRPLKLGLSPKTEH